MVESHFDTKRARLLDNEERIKELKPNQLLKNIGGIAKGMTCIDLGSGTGTFSFPMVHCVGDKGVVYAVDDSSEMLEHIRAKNPPLNLRLVHANASHTGLDSQIADFCLLASILHEVKQPGSLMAEAFRLLKTQGRALAIEWKAHLDSPGPPRSRRITREHLERLFNKVGFTQLEYIDWSKNRYVAIGTK